MHKFFLQIWALIAFDMLVIWVFYHNSFSVVLLYYCTFYTAMHRKCCCFFSSLNNFTPSRNHSFVLATFEASEEGKKKAEIKQQTDSERRENKWKVGKKEKKTIGRENKPRNYANRRQQSQEPEGQRGERVCCVLGEHVLLLLRCWSKGEFS